LITVPFRPAAPVCIRVRWQAEWLQLESCFGLSAGVLKPLAFVTNANCFMSASLTDFSVRFKKPEERSHAGNEL
jgi:hypothetical protein